jgi:hypothetical protein
MEKYYDPSKLFGKKPFPSSNFYLPTLTVPIYFFKKLFLVFFPFFPVHELKRLKKKVA